MYLELHCHSSYSLREGASSPRDLVEQAARLGYKTLALTDHDGLYGAMEFAKLADASGLQPITGAEVTLTGGYHLTLLAETAAGYANLCRLISHAYLDHSKDAPEVTFDVLARHTQGLIALSGCKRGEVPGLVQAGLIDRAEAAALRYRDWFGSRNFFVELQQNLALGDTARNAALIGLAERLDLACVATNNVHYHIRERHRLHDVLTAIRHRTTLDASHQLRRENSEYYLKSPWEMARLFATYPRALKNTLIIAERCAFNLARDLDYRFPHYPVPAGETPDSYLERICREALQRKYGATPPGDEDNKTAKQSQLSRTRPTRFSKTASVSCPDTNTSVPRTENKTAKQSQFPSTQFDTTTSPPRTENKTAKQSQLLTRRPDTAAFPKESDVLRTAPRPYLSRPPASRPPVSTETLHEAEQRLEEELWLIRKHRLAGFFLTYRDILKTAGEVAAQLRGRDPSLPPDEHPVGRGRGSSVSSIVCYLIGLSHIDPIKTELFLGRFLNEELHSIPDIDLDFPRDVREKLLERVYRDFGEERAALVCSFATYRLRSAIRDIGKALGLPPVELDKLAKLSDRWGSASIAEEMARIPEFRDRVDAPPWRDLIDLVPQILRLPRHIGQHVGGVVLSSRPLKELVPLEPARMPGRVVCQWDKDSVDDARFVKIDFLALGMLSLVDECLDIIEKRHGQRPDLGRIPHDDPKIFDKICAGDTIGMFQIESRAQIQSLPRTQPRTIDDLTAQVAIIRPGPILAGAFHPYMEYRRRMRAGEDVDVKYLHPCLKGVLGETLGVILYQEQVLQVAMVAAGYSAGEADMLRRDMGKRNADDILQTHWPRFLAGAQQRGLSEEVARAVFQQLTGFSGYGFPKSHAAAFALLAYESAWLRTHFPAEYYCALFNNQPMGFYSPEVLVGDARRHGVAIVRPDVNLSLAKYNVETPRTVRLGLSYVQKIGLETAQAIVQEGERGGEFRSLFDFVRRTRLRREAIENLIAASAFESFGLEQRELLWQLGLFCTEEGHQAPLDFPVDQDMVSLPPMSPRERLVAEYKALDLSTHHHPLALLRPQLGGRIVPIVALQKIADGAEVQLAGMIVCRQRPGTGKGVVFLLLEDESGLANVVVYPRLFERQRTLIRLEPFVIVAGTVQRQDKTINVVAHSFHPLHLPTPFINPASHDFY
ncbi:MAG: DNA polymerase III subunit alpha [Chloroflexi bacterium]|nr:DNA polymerase III subunit alpha [Chloroflexota bacterium]